MSEVYLLWSGGTGSEYVVDVYATADAAMAAKPGKWKRLGPVGDEPGYWEGVTENEPGWHKGRGHFMVERCEVHS